MSFNIKDIYSDEAVSMLDKMGICARGGLHCSPLAHKHMGTIESGTIRVVPGVFNTFDDMNKLLNAVAIISRK